MVHHGRSRGGTDAESLSAPSVIALSLRSESLSGRSTTVPSAAVSRTPSYSAFPTFPDKHSDVETIISLDFEPQKSEEWARGVGFWRCFIAVCVPILLSAFEGSVVSTALPIISRSLGLGPNSSWVATSFLLASIVCQPLYGQLADIWGRRHLMMLAVVIFAIGSAIAAFANTGIVMIFGRITQGLGSGGIDLFAELILCDIIPLQRRGHYVAIKAAVYALGTTVGPILGGVFAETNWRWCFGVNIPVCAMALFMMYLWLQVSNGKDSSSPSSDSDPTPPLARVDFVGILLLTTSVVLLLFALSSGGAAYPWTSLTILATSASGMVGIVLFALWESLSPWCLYPIMSPHIFSNRTTVAGFIVTMIHGFITYGFQFYLPPLFQTALGASPTESGVYILPCSLTIVVLAAIGGPLLSKFGQYRLMHIGGFVLMALGLALCAVVEASTCGKLWIFFTFLVGIGSGIIVSTTLPTVLVELTDKENAAATGSWAFLRGLGSLLGVAIPGAGFNIKVEELLPSIKNTFAREQLMNGRAYEHASAVFLGDLDATTKMQVGKVFSESFQLVWIVFLAFASMGIMATFLERQVELRAELDSDYGLKQKTVSESAIGVGKRRSESSISKV